MSQAGNTNLSNFGCSRNNKLSMRQSLGNGTERTRCWVSGILSPSIRPFRTRLAFRAARYHLFRWFFYLGSGCYDWALIYKQL